MSATDKYHEQTTTGVDIIDEGTPKDILQARARSMTREYVTLLKKYPGWADQIIPIEKKTPRLIPGKTVRAKLIAIVYDWEGRRSNICLDDKGRYWMKMPENSLRPDRKLNDHFKKKDLGDYGGDVLQDIIDSLREQTLILKGKLKQRDKDQVMKQAKKPSEDYPVAPTDNIDHT